MGDLITFDSNLYSVISLMYHTLGIPIDSKWAANYFLIYINNISKASIENIDKFFKSKYYYLGTCDMSFDSKFKSYISHVSVATQYVKIGNKIFNADPDIEFTEYTQMSFSAYVFLFFPSPQLLVLPYSKFYTPVLYPTCNVFEYKKAVVHSANFLKINQSPLSKIY